MSVVILAKGKSKQVNDGNLLKHTVVCYINVCPWHNGRLSTGFSCLNLASLPLWMMKSLSTKISCGLLVLMQFKGTQSAYIFPNNFAKYFKVCFRLAQDFKFSQQQVARPTMGSRAEGQPLPCPSRLGCHFGALLRIEPSHTTPKEGPEENPVWPFPKHPINQQLRVSTKALVGSDLILPSAWEDLNLHLPLLIL